MTISIEQARPAQDFILDQSDLAKRYIAMGKEQLDIPIANAVARYSLERARDARAGWLMVKVPPPPPRPPIRRRRLCRSACRSSSVNGEDGSDEQA